ncbi:MAG TPA: FG-GAP-like repeat-containing protein [Anaerolineae bacterium]|nr:FG-GAP-like repeat-containing protein [Anaerolineae bacterium]
MSFISHRFLGKLVIAFWLVTAVFTFWPTPAVHADPPTFDPYSFGAYNNTTTVRAGDIDRDGQLDVVVANATVLADTPSLVIYYNQDNGNMDNNISLQNTLQTRDIILADFNQDGWLDIATANEGQPNFISYNDGTGQFYTGDVNCNTPPATIVCLNNSNDASVSLTTADFNQDGWLDIVVANTDNVLIYLHDDRRPGRFLSPTSLFSVTPPVYDVAATDLNQDGRPDLLVVDNNGINRYFHDGTTFYIGYATLTSETMDEINTADLNQDGFPDLVATGASQSRYYTYLNNGDDIATFGLPTTYTTFLLLSIVLGDLNGDGLPDLIEGRSASGNRIRLNDGTGTFGDFSELPVSSNAYSIAIADFNNDGANDFANGVFGYNSIYFNNQNNEFSPFGPSAPLLNTTLGTAAATGDLNGDGWLDAVITNADQQNFIYFNDGTGQFDTGPIDCNQPVATHPLVHCLGAPDDITHDVALGDLDNDGDLDILFGNGGGAIDFHTTVHTQTNEIWFNDGVGNFSNLVNLVDYAGGTTAVAMADLNNDGALDIAIANGHPSGRINRYYLNDGLGNFNTATTLSALDLTTDIAIGDLDRDGYLDIATTGIDQTYLYRNQGNGTFAPAIELIPSTNGRDISFADLDADGFLDILIGTQQSQSRILYNDGAGNFPNITQFGELNLNYDLDAVDVDGDGDLDIVESNFGEDAIVRNLGNRQFVNANYSFDDSSNSGLFTRDTAWGDFDNNGMIDAILAKYYFSSPPFSHLVQYNVAPIAAGFPNQHSTLQLDRPVPTQADLFSDPTIVTGNIITIPYQINDNQGDLAGPLRAYYSPDGGGQWLPAVPTAGTVTDHLPTHRTTTHPDDNLTPLPLPSVITTTDVITVTGLPTGSYLTDIDVQLDISHVWVSDLDIYLIAPDGTRVELATDVGDSGDNFSQTIFDQEASALIATTTAPFTGRFRPEGDLTTLYGQNPNGAWTLEIFDDDPLDSGTLNSWQLNITSMTPVPYTSQDPTLPLPFGNAPTIITSALHIAQPHQIQDLNLWFNIDHTYDEDVIVELIAPTGERAILVDFVGFGGDNFVNTVLDDEAPLSITAGTAPFTGRFIPQNPLATFDGLSAQGVWQLRVTDRYPVADDGTLLSWGLDMQTTTNQNEYYWDTFASGFFGQSANVRLRFEIGTDPTAYLPFTTPGPQQAPYIATTSFPFALRGTQIQVFSDTVASTNALPNALVYRLPAGATVGEPISNGTTPFRTDAQGYLQGRSQLGLNDTLVALVPITATESYTLYYTSAEPTESGLNGHLVTEPGVQQLVVSSQRPLLLLNLDISLEWDARNDPNYINQLQDDLQRTSEILYDVTDGQAALGRLNIYHNKQNWSSAHILIHAANNIRPSASLGGIVTTPQDDIISPTQVITDAYLPGQVSMGATWNRFGDPDANLGEDWPRTLAHELGHFAFFLPDNYLGLADGAIITTDCYGSFMTNLYQDEYSEFLTEAEWTGPCLQTIAEQITGRTDWETINRIYPWLNPPATTLAGPSELPLAVTQLTFHDDGTPAETLAAPFFSLRDSSNNPIYVPGGRGEAFLFKNWAEPTSPGPYPDTYVIGQGSPVGDQIEARGAAPGDRLCLYDYSQADTYIGCALVGTNAGNISLEPVPGWQPQLQISFLTTQTMHITVAQSIPAGDVFAQILPAIGDGPPFPLTSTVAALNPNPARDLFTQQVELPYPAVSGFVRVWVAGSSPPQEVMSEFFLGEGWGGKRAGWGGKRAGWGGKRAGWGGKRAGWGAPVASGDGQVIIFNVNDVFADTGTSYLQKLTTLPTLPSWLTPIGQAYRFAGSQPVDRNIAFNYLQTEVPGGNSDEHLINIYYSPDNGQSWQRLPTTQDPLDNLATATMPSAQNGDGIYLLASTLTMPPFTVGWNSFGYPLYTSRPITTALASIDGAYSAVYHYDWQADSWHLFDTGVLTTHPDLSPVVNDLTTLHFGQAYWLYATSNITLYLPLDPDTPDGFTDDSLNAITFPPTTYYGPIAATPTFTPSAGLPVTATINGQLCGQTTTQLWDGQIIYRLQVKADSGDACGAVGATVTFYVDGQMADSTHLWDHSRAWYHPLTAVAPPEQPTLTTLTPFPPDLQLIWNDLPPNTNYELWVSTTPYTPDDTLLTTTPSTTYTHLNSLTDPATNHYYHLRALNPLNQRSTPSNEMGAFTFAVVAGN